MPHTVEQPDKTPTRKVSAAGVSAAVATLAVWVLTTFVGVDVPAEAAGAIATVVGFVTAYLVPEWGPDVDLSRRLGR